MPASMPPSTVPHNRWDLLDHPTSVDREPTRSVTVVMPYFESAQALRLTMAGLARQTYPGDLFEIVVVDDGSAVPLVVEEPTYDLNLRVVQQERRGFGAGRARNLGAEMAGGEVILFLDSDMIPEDGWIEAHLGWHHQVGDAVSLGFRRHLEPSGVSEEMIHSRSTTMEELFADRHTERPEWIEYHMTRTGNLTSRDDDLFRVVTSGNFGISKEFFDEVGGFDTSFSEWGGEDTEFGYRAYVLGGLLIPERDALCWHQGLGVTPDSGEILTLEQNRAKLSHLIAHRGFRRALPGRSFSVPQVVAIVEPNGADAPAVLATVEHILANDFHDLVVSVPTTGDAPGARWLRSQLDPDPRVDTSPTAALGLFPHTPLQITIPAGARLDRGAIGNVISELGESEAATAELDGDTQITITRTRALHRARRADLALGQVCDIKQLHRRDTGIWFDGATSASRSPSRLRRWRSPDSNVGRVIRQVQRIRTPKSAWRFVRWLAGALRRRFGSPRLKPPVVMLGSDEAAPHEIARYPLGASFATVGERARRLLAASSRVRSVSSLDDLEAADVEQLDVVLTSNGAAVETGVDLTGIVVLGVDALAASARTAAIDPETAGPIGWIRAHDGSAVAIAFDQTPAQVPDVDRVVESSSTSGPGHQTTRFEVAVYAHHVEDRSALHADVNRRAARLVRLAAHGALVHVPDIDQPLADLLGPDLAALLADHRLADADHHVREQLSIGIRRAALRTHSLRARARQIVEAAALPPIPLADVSVILATNRPEHLKAAIASVARQTYPRLELVLALHGEGFSGSVESETAHFAHNVKVVRIARDLSLGDALNVAVSAASGSLITKFDDDDHYGPEHVWDLVLAKEYSKAHIVGKGAEFVYLTRSDCTIHRLVGQGESYSTTIAGGTLLLSRQDLIEAGGWRRVARAVDRGLIEDIQTAGGTVYRTHGFGYVLVRRLSGHTWESDDSYFLDQAEDQRVGLDLGYAGIDLP